MKRLLSNIILVIFVLGSLFYVTHIHQDQEAGLSTNHSYMSHYPTMPDMTGYPMPNIPF